MHKLLQNEPGKKVLLLGNEAIARGAVEAGVGFATTYPGTPSSEISLNLFQISDETDLYFEYSTNEKVALEVAAAAAASGVRTLCMMKHVGLNVAADPLMTLAYVGVKGGMVIITADDPAMFSSQNEQDNRYYAKLSGLPMMEPSSIEEAKEMIKVAFDISEALEEPVLFRTTTRINHSTGEVSLGEIPPVKAIGNFQKDPLSYVAVPAVSRMLHVKLLKNYEKAEALANESSWNFIEGAGKYGVICNGVSYNYVSDAVKDLDADGKIKILRIGFSHPMPAGLIQEFLAGCEKVLVVEEGEPVMEEAVRSIAQENGVMAPIKGKGENLFSRLGEFNPALVRQSMATYFELPYEPVALPDLSNLPEMPQRPPNLCAGCSHRATFYEIKTAAKDMDVIYPTDIGCYTLGFLPPLSMADYVICMGSSVSTASGFSRATGKKVVAFIGDSTFFHSGMTGLVNAVFNNHNFTLVILDNGTTAMTGHQPNPGVDMAALDKGGYNPVSIEKLVEAMGVKHISIIKPFKVNKSIAQIKEAFAFQGVSVIISKQPCALFEKALKIKPKRPFEINANKCKDHRNCVNELACPAFFIEEDQVKINATQCVGCALCAQICPENAILPVKE
jgi:indolepyruvate ferredoxin oxidoreductase, alpha subunit